MLLRHLLDEGLTKTDIAARLGVSRGAIYRWIRTGQLAREQGVIGDATGPVRRFIRAQVSVLKVVKPPGPRRVG